MYIVLGRMPIFRSAIRQNRSRIRVVVARVYRARIHEGVGEDSAVNDPGRSVYERAHSLASMRPLESRLRISSQSLNHVFLL